MTTRTAALPGGTITYEDSGGTGPVVVLLHGLLMDATLWDDVVAELAPEHRCVVPTLPLGAHVEPMPPDADLALPAIADLVVQLLDHLALDDLTLVGNDTGGAVVQLVAADDPPRVRRIVLASCDAFDNFPPRVTGTALVRAGRLPPSLFGLFMQQMRLRPARRLPIAFGWLTKRGDAATARWIRALLSRAEIRRDAVKVLRAIRADRSVLERVAERLPAFGRPALVVWASEDRIMPIEHAHRLLDLLPDGRLVEIADSYTLIPLDRPSELAAAIRTFVAT
ncbi:alpha/beta hydrolase [Patulibacter sp. NPDC049589]|uniref:alpha/beta fold hydrolase n=1 Tax=Patulibacter sp. NPDC049589 TaxID=3154731 RepID=UPI003443A0EC